MRVGPSRISVGVAIRGASRAESYRSRRSQRTGSRGNSGAASGKANGVPRESRFVITAASELMALLALAGSRQHLRRRLNEISRCSDDPALRNVPSGGGPRNRLPSRCVDMAQRAGAALFGRLAG